MTTYRRKAGDTGPAISEVLYLDDRPYTLSGATVRLIAKRKSNGTASSLAATVVNATAGRVQCDISSIMATPDFFSFEWEITDASGILTFPGDGYNYLYVISDQD